MTDLTDSVDKFPVDGRVYLKCRKCGERVAIYRFFPGECHSKDATPGKLKEFLDRHSSCFIVGESGYPESVPDLVLEVG